MWHSTDDAMGGCPGIPNNLNGLCRVPLRLLIDMVILSYTSIVKTAISVPDSLYAGVEAKVSELGMSRSQFYAVAVQRYLDELSRADLVARINEAIDLETEESRQETKEFVTTGVASSQARLGNDQW